MADAEHKINALDEDVRTIYGMVEDIKRDVRDVRGRIIQQGTRLDGVAGTVRELEERVRIIEAVQIEHGVKLDRILALLEPQD